MNIRAKLIVGGLVLAAGVLTGCASEAPTAVDATPDAVSAEEATAILGRQADAAWKEVSGTYPNAVRPEVAVVREIEQDEWSKVMADCLVEQGFPVSATASGIETGDIPAAQAQAYFVAKYVCAVQYPNKPEFYLPLNDSQLRYLYAYYSGELLDCLAKEGYDVSEAPSFESFKESNDSADAWTPYRDLGSLSSSEFSKLNKTCPQTPSGLYG